MKNRIHSSASQHGPKLYRFALSLWMGVGAVAVVAPWPYAVVAIMFATFLHLAALDGDGAGRDQPERKRQEAENL